MPTTVPPTSTRPACRPVSPAMMASAAAIPGGQAFWPGKMRESNSQ